MCSSVSGGLNALSAVTLYDFIRPVYFNTKGKELDDKTTATLSRFFSQWQATFLLFSEIEIQEALKCTCFVYNVEVMH